jgi:hypothetical protein
LGRKLCGHAPKPTTPKADEGLREKRIREFLWLNHGLHGPSLYGDDGEMQCKECRI